MTEDVEALRQEIRSAFAWRAYPGDHQLALAPGCPGDDCDDVARFFRGKDWREIRLDLIADSELDTNAFLYFMNVEGFVYFLPAFLIESLDIDGRFDLGEPLAFRLTPPQGEPGEPGVAAAKDHFSRIVASLAPEEKRAVAHVLEYLAKAYVERGDTLNLNLAKGALDGYWAELVDWR